MNIIILRECDKVQVYLCGGADGAGAGPGVKNT